MDRIRWRGSCSGKATNVIAIAPLSECQLPYQSVVRRLMRLMRLVPIHQTPNTSKKHTQHKIYPYLLWGLTID